MQITSLLPKFASKTQRIQVGNGQYVKVLFIIPIIVDKQGHRFKVYTLISKIHENVDIVLRIKNIFRGSNKFMRMLLQLFKQIYTFVPKGKDNSKAKKKQKLIKIEAPFVDKISGLAIVKIADKLTQSTLMLKVKFT